MIPTVRVVEQLLVTSTYQTDWIVTDSASQEFVWASIGKPKLIRRKKNRHHPLLNKNNKS